MACAHTGRAVPCYLLNEEDHDLQSKDVECRDCSPTHRGHLKRTSERKLGLLAGVITRLDPQVVALQELGGADPFRDLQQALEKQQGI